jgi:hypothetical protein
MPTIEMRELAFAVLDSVTGGVEGYHYCAVGSQTGGEGLYPNYVPCATTWADIFNAWVRVGQGGHA